MQGCLWTLAVSLSLQAGYPAPYEPPGAPVPAAAYSEFVGGSLEQRYPYDTQQAWVHGYFQEIPAYGGYYHFRPYNYKHVLSQSQTAAGWGMPPTMPYSQQFWHRYDDRAKMVKLSEIELSPYAPYVPTIPSQQPYAPAYGTPMYGAPSPSYNPPPAYQPQQHWPTQPGMTPGLPPSPQYQGQPMTPR